MKTLFFFFTVFILLLLELWFGTLTVYMPLMWMGFFYFSVCRYPFKLLAASGFVAAIILDTVLYQRFFMPDIFIFAAMSYMSWRYHDFWNMSIWSGGIHGCFLIVFACIIQTVSAAFSHGFHIASLVDAAAQMTALIPVIFLLQTLQIYIFDKVQKKLHFNKFFVADRKNSSMAVYRRRGEYSR